MSGLIQTEPKYFSRKYKYVHPNNRIYEVVTNKPYEILLTNLYAFEKDTSRNDHWQWYKNTSLSFGR